MLESFWSALLAGRRLLAPTRRAIEIHRARFLRFAQLPRRRAGARPTLRCSRTSTAPGWSRTSTRTRSQSDESRRHAHGQDSGTARSPDTAPKCLACHALDVPGGQRARTFDLTDGVSCENCHGPASNWLGPHTTRGLDARKIASQPGCATRAIWCSAAENCLTCHLGTAEKTVDHEMIAAGHPDLYFELAVVHVRDAARTGREAATTDPWFATFACWPSDRPCSCASSCSASRANRKAASGPNTPIWIASPAITA